jgi:hypothetical protein
MSPTKWTANFSASVCASPEVQCKSLVSRPSSAMMQSPFSVLALQSRAALYAGTSSGMSTKCHPAVSGRTSRASSAQLAIEASERPLKSVATMRAAGSERRCCATSAMMEWPSWPQANAFPVSAQTSAAANANDLMADPPFSCGGCQRRVTI